MRLGTQPAGYSSGGIFAFIFRSVRITSGSCRSIILAPAVAAARALKEKPLDVFIDDLAFLP